MSVPSSPPPSTAPPYSEIYSRNTGHVVNAPNGAWGGGQWASPQGGPGYPAVTSTGYAPVEMAGNENIAELSSNGAGGNGAYKYEKK